MKYLYVPKKLDSLRNTADVSPLSLTDLDSPELRDDVVSVGLREFPGGAAVVSEVVRGWARVQGPFRGAAPPLEKKRTLWEKSYLG